VSCGRSGGLISGDGAYAMISGGQRPFLRSWMMFVDGENLTIQSERLAAAAGADIVRSVGPTHYRSDAFFWTPKIAPLDAWLPVTWVLQPHGLRAYYYTSAVGNEETIPEIERSLRAIGFHPKVFRKAKGSKSKGVDVALTKDVLSHAFLGNYEAAVLIAGDGDYKPLVEEVQRLGKLVYLAFFASRGAGLSEALKVACDGFHGFDADFTSLWQ
jgi:hypothetical protein